MASIDALRSDPLVLVAVAQGTVMHTAPHSLGRTGRVLGGVLAFLLATPVAVKGGEPATCIDASHAAGDRVRSGDVHTIESDHFIVSYTTTGPDSILRESFPNEVVANVERTYDVLSVELGMRAPSGTYESNGVWKIEVVVEVAERALVVVTLGAELAPEGVAPPSRAAQEVKTLVQRRVHEARPEEADVAAPENRLVGDTAIGEIDGVGLDQREARPALQAKRRGRRLVQLCGGI